MGWQAVVSMAARIFSMALLFAAIFATGPWLSWFSYYSDLCAEDKARREGTCIYIDPYRCSICVIVGYIWIIFAFFLLLARIILWASPLEFRQKTRKFALLFDCVTIIFIFLTCLLITIGGSQPKSDGTTSIQTTNKYPLLGDFLFSVEIDVWFSFALMIIAIVLDILDMRSGQ